MLVLSVLSNLPKGQVELKSWTRKTEDSLGHWTSASQSFFLALCVAFFHKIHVTLTVNFYLLNTQICIIIMQASLYTKVMCVNYFKYKYM